MLRKAIIGIAALAVSLSPALALAAVPVQSPVFNRADVTDAGPLPSQSVIPLNIVLSFQRETELRDLVRNQATRGTPLFQHFLTKDQFVATYSPSVEQYTQTINRLKAAGFAITRTDPDRNMIGVTGSVSLVDRYFSTEMHQVVQQGRRLYANRTKETIPSDIAPTVSAVLGLNNLALVQPHIAFPRSAPPRLNTLQPYSVSPRAIGGPTNGPNGSGFGPSAIASAYNIPANYGFTGAGRRIGIVGGGNFLDSDLQAYINFFQVNRTGPTYREPTGAGGVFSTNDANNSLEAILDIATIAGLAPGAIIDFKNAPAPLSNSNLVEEVYELLGITNPGVDVISISYGGCEGSDTNFDTSIDQAAIRANSQGVSVAASSGDVGYEGCGTSHNVNDVDSPASDPNVTAIGGTSPYTETLSTLGYGNEYGWTGSGGGYSPRYAEPPWQHTSLGASTRRNLPDIAFAADPSYGNPIYYNGSNILVGGTSWSAPIWASIQTEINQEQNKYHGNANARIYDNYYVYLYTSPSGVPMFRDCTQGNNGVAAVAGWDFVCGIGSVNGQGLARTE